MDKIFERTINLIGEDNFNKVKHSKVIIFGVGGVGGYALEMLARSGVNNITIVDFDTVNETNINRQIIALNSTVGKFKVDVFKERLVDINPNLNLTTINGRVCEENLEEFKLLDYDYVIDCIDSFADKLALIKYCYFNGINIISSMGAGNRFKPTTFLVQDIFKTTNDSLARKLRLSLKKLNIKKLTVCCPTTVSDNTTNKAKVFSISYNVALSGITIASFVVNDIIKSKKA